MKLLGGCKDADLVDHLEDEIADVYAALAFLSDHNALDFARIAERVEMKHKRWTDKRNGVKAHG